MSSIPTQSSSVKQYNTFGIDASADRIINIGNITELKTFFNNKKESPILILGGGSNILFTKDFHGTILLNKMMGFEITSINADSVTIEVGSGESWHQLVLKTVALGYGGLENLSLIPGTVGAAPIQNIGAYGAEVKDVIHEVNFYNIEKDVMETLFANGCNFGYRDSIFKQALKNRIFITSVVFKLSINAKVNVQYEDVKTLFGNQKDITLQMVSDAIVQIRTQKLPDPKKLGNSGSFFKNPIISVAHFETLKQYYPQIKGYPGLKGVKLAAGWLIEQAGWKGYRKGDAGVHERQALVLINYGSATGKEIYKLSSEIIGSVQHKFGVSLEREVQIY